MVTRPKWKFVDNRGIERIGAVINTTNFYGSDVVYTFVDEDGDTHCLHGQQLDKASRVWNETIEVAR